MLYEAFLQGPAQSRGDVKRRVEITGLHPETIRRGRRGLDNGLAERPLDRVCLPGGGRPTVEE